MVENTYMIAGKERKRKEMRYGVYCDLQEELMGDGIIPGEKIKIKLTKSLSYKLVNAIIDPAMSLNEFENITDKREMLTLQLLVRDAVNELADIGSEMSNVTDGKGHLMPSKKK